MEPGGPIPLAGPSTPRTLSTAPTTMKTMETILSMDEILGRDDEIDGEQRTRRERMKGEVPCSQVRPQPAMRSTMTITKATTRTMWMDPPTVWALTIPSI